MKIYLKALLVILVVFTMLILGKELRGEKEQTEEKTDLNKLAATLKLVTEVNFEGMNKEDVKMAMSTIHPKSFLYEETKRAIVQMIEMYDLKYSLVSFKLICLDDDYAIVRIKQLTTKIKGPEFRDNEVELYNIFRKDRDDWKIWQTAILEVNYLEKTPKKEEKK